MMIEDIALFIDGLGYGNYYPTGYEPDNNIFLNNLPQNPNNVICIYDTGGEGKPVGFPDTKRRIQILVRNESIQLANTISWSIHNALTNHAKNGYVVSNGRQMVITSVNTPISIGKDQNSLFEFSTNYDVWTKGDL